MKRLTAHESLAYIGHLKNVLEQSGVACIIRNAQLSGGLGEIPFLECLPELWVVEDSELARAKVLLEEIETLRLPGWVIGSSCDWGRRQRRSHRWPVSRSI